MIRICQSRANSNIAGPIIPNVCFHSLDLTGLHLPRRSGFRPFVGQRPIVPEFLDDR